MKKDKIQVIHTDETVQNSQENKSNTFSLSKKDLDIIEQSKAQKQQGISSEVIYKAQVSQYNLDNDVILSAITRNELEESLAKIKYHKIIYEDWGFGEVDKLGRSSILNFYGSPGTGKTLTAEAFAGRLGLPIIKLGIAEIESKMMGETSKNIQQAFADAHTQGAVIFFDEADTLLGKRLSSVTQGVDNEVNAMRSTMLIELEKFDGIVIFATNFAKNYDEAFRSRISYHVEFTLPDLETRKQLWSKMLVKRIPLIGDRDEIVQICAEQSEGFSGREIRTCMRLALPKPLREAENSDIEPNLKQEHLLSAIENIRKAQKEVASSIESKDKRKIAAARSLLGVKKASSTDIETSNDDDSLSNLVIENKEATN